MCAKVTQYSRISHHTIAGSASAGLTFSIPPQEDFTDGSWTPYDLALSEIGVNEQDKKVYIRVTDDILEFGLYGSGSNIGVTPSWGQVLSVGNTSDGNNIIMDSGGQILSGTGEVLTAFSDTGIVIQTQDVSFLQQINLDPNSIVILTTENSTTNTSLLDLTTDYANLSHGDGFSGDNSNVEVGYGGGTSYVKLEITSTLTTAQLILNNLGITTTADAGIINVYGRSFVSNTQVSHEVLNGFTGSSLLVTPTFVSMGSADTSTTLTNTITTDTSKITLISDDISLITQPSKIEINPTDIDIFAADTCSIGNLTNKISLGNQEIILSDFSNGIIYDALLTNAEPNVYRQSDLSTTNNTSTQISVINFGITNSVITIEAVVNGFGATNSKAYGAKLFGTFKNVSGTVTQLSTTDKSEKTDFSTATSDFNISGIDVQIRVTGEVSTDINWASRFNYQISK